MLVVWWPSFCFPPSQLGVISYDGRYVSSGYLPSMFCALEVWPETRFSPSRRFLNVDCRCNSGFLKRIAYTTMPYKTGLGLLGVARNPANGFPARLLGCTFAHVGPVLSQFLVAGSVALGPAWDNMIWVSYGSWSCEHHSSTKSWMSLLLSCGGQWATVSGAFFLSEFRNYPLFALSIR